MDTKEFDLNECRGRTREFGRGYKNTKSEQFKETKGFESYRRDWRIENLCDKKDRDWDGEGEMGGLK